MEFGPAKDSGNSAAQEHRVEEDESADRGVGIFAENHERDEPDGRSLELELLRGIVSQRDTDDAKQRVECAHKGVVDIFGVFLAGLELERAVISGKDTRETDKHLSEGRVDIKVVFVLDVVATEFSKAATLSANDDGAIASSSVLTELRPK